MATNPLPDDQPFDLAEADINDLDITASSSSPPFQPRNARAQLPWLLRARLNILRFFDRLLLRRRWRIIDARSGRIMGVFYAYDLYAYLTDSMVADAMLASQVRNVRPTDFLDRLFGPPDPNRPDLAGGYNCGDPNCLFCNPSTARRRDSSDDSN